MRERPVSLFGSLPPPPPVCPPVVCPSPHPSLPHFFNRSLPFHLTFAHALAPPSTTVSAPLPRFTCPVSLSLLLSLCAPTISPSFCFCVSLSFSCVLHPPSSLLSIYLSLLLFLRLSPFFMRAIYLPSLFSCVPRRTSPHRFCSVSFLSFVLYFFLSRSVAHSLSHSFSLFHPRSIPLSPPVSFLLSFCIPPSLFLSLALPI